MSLSDVIEGELNLGKNSPPAVTNIFRSKYKDHYKLYNVYYEFLKDGINKYKYITIRPHDHLIMGMYNKIGHEQLLPKYLEEITNIIKHPFIGSVEFHNNHFIHFHLIIKCSKTSYDEIRRSLTFKYATLERTMKLKQYAITHDKLKDERLRLFFLYRLGYSVHLGRIKDSFLYQITNNEIYLKYMKNPITQEHLEHMVALEEYQIEKIQMMKAKSQCKKDAGII